MATLLEDLLLELVHLFIMRLVFWPIQVGVAMTTSVASVSLKKAPFVSSVIFGLLSSSLWKA